MSGDERVRIGIIAEFNPLHSGHKYLIECARKIANENNGEVICVMSEFFTQRGEVAIVDGYARAREAVRSGCDMVIALPYLGSVAYGDDFARKSIEILAGAGVTHLRQKSGIRTLIYIENNKKQQKKNINDY